MATAVSLGLAVHSCADGDSGGARSPADADAGITATTSRSDLAARAAIHAYILAAYGARAAIHAYILAAYAAAPATHAYAGTSVETDLPADADIPADSAAFSG